MRYIKLFEDYNKNKFPIKICDSLYDEKDYKELLNAFIKYHFGNGYNLLNYYINIVNNIYENGGNIYRGFYADDINNIRGLNPINKGNRRTLDY